MLVTAVTAYQPTLVPTLAIQDGFASRSPRVTARALASLHSVGTAEVVDEAATIELAAMERPRGMHWATFLRHLAKEHRAVAEMFSCFQLSAG